MSKTITIRSNLELMKQIRGSLPLKPSQHHKSVFAYKRKEKHFKGWEN